MKKANICFSVSLDEERQGIQALDREYQVVVRRIALTAINSRRRVNHLPKNILVHIFSLVRNPQPNSPQPDYRSLLSISQVCKAWRQFTHEDSLHVRRLWACGFCWIDPLCLHPQLLNLILKRSGDALVNLSLNLENGSPDRVDWCSQNISHLRSFQIQARNPDDFAWIACAEGDHLEALYLHFHHSIHNVNPLPRLCNGKTPRLRDLRLNGVRFHGKAENTPILSHSKSPYMTKS